MTGSPWWTLPSSLEPFSAAGVLERAEVHLAATLARLAGLDESAADMVLAAALAARAPRLGHVGVDLATVAAEAATDPDLVIGGAEVAEVADVTEVLEWPDPSTWLERVATCPLVVPADDTVAPLVIHHGLLYLERHRTDERVVAAQILRRAMASRERAGRAASSLSTTGAGVARTLLTGPGSEHQLAAVESSLAGGLTVLLGGPGTGKTTTVAALVAELIERSDAASPVELALAAPTGKAAARLGEAFRDAAARLPVELAAPLLATEATTIHRLLGTMPGSRSRFRHHGRHPLPHDVVIVDESSMISLPLMARLLDAVRPDARVVIVGDPDQLASVEAGSVLGDVAAAADHASLGAASPLRGCVTTLRHSRRFPPDSPIGHLADAIRRGDAAAALAVLAPHASDGNDVDGVDGVDGAAGGEGALRWVGAPAGSEPAAHVVRRDIVPASLDVIRAAGGGDALAALEALGRVRVLCAHRIGPSGIELWNRRIEAWSNAPAERWYPGRPVLVTANDHRNRLYNGDLGVVVDVNGRRSVAFADAADASGVRFIGPSRLESVETTHAMTIHKSQGSEFDHVVVLLPSAGSRLATRDLLYTAVTRARHRVTLVGDRDAVAAAVERRTVRASGLATDLLAGHHSPDGTPSGSSR